MSRKNRAFEFELFDSPDGAYSVFENSLRSGMEYNANIEDQFDAVVLTRPTKVTYDPRFISFKTDDNPGSEKFAFMVRVLGDKSPHKFLPDPCLLYELNTADAQRRAFNLIQQHTKVIMQADNDESLPEINSIVRIALERNRRGSFKTDVTKRFISIVNSDPKPPPSGQTCQTLVDALKYGDISTLGGGFEILEEKYSISDFEFESIPQPTAAEQAIILEKAIGQGGHKDKTASGRTVITSLIHYPTYQAIRGKPVPAAMKRLYDRDIHTAANAWSSWFLNRVYVLPPAPSYSEIIKWAKRFEYSGCCYPSPFAALNRNELLNADDPADYEGNIMLILVSQEEIDAAGGSLDLVYGDASVVGVHSTKQWEDTRNETKNVGSGEGGNTHLNVFVGDKTEDPRGRQFIGGNLSDTVLYKDNLNNPGGYMKFVRVKKFIGTKK